MADKSEGGTVAQADFARTLAALKRRGSNVLLVGLETVEGHGALCHRLLGENVASRYRLLVTDSRTRTVQSCHESSESCSTHETPTTRTIDYATAGAGVVAAGAAVSYETVKNGLNRESRAFFSLDSV